MIKVEWNTKLVDDKEFEFFGFKLFQTKEEAEAHVDFLRGFSDVYNLEIGELKDSWISDLYRDRM